MAEDMQQIGEKLNELNKKLHADMDPIIRSRLCESIAIAERQYNKIYDDCLHISYIKDNVINKIKNNEWDITYIKEDHLINLMYILLNYESDFVQYEDALQTLIYMFLFINKKNISKGSIDRPFDKIKATYSKSFNHVIGKLFIKLKQLILCNNTNTKNKSLSILLIYNLCLAINDENTKLYPNDISLFTNLCKLNSSIEVLIITSAVSKVFIFDDLSNQQYVDESKQLIKNLNLLITYDCDRILFSAITSYEKLFYIDPHIAPKLRHHTINKQQFETESERKLNDDESLVTMFVNQSYRNWNAELPPIALIKLMVKYLSPINGKMIKLRTLDPIQRFVELIIHESDQVNSNIINLLYEIIVIGHVYIYLFDVNMMMINLLHYMRYSDKSIFKSFNLMMGCIAFGDENTMKHLIDVQVFIECIEKTLIYDEIEMDDFVLIGINKLLKFYKNNNGSMNKLWNSWQKMEKNEKLSKHNIGFIHYMKRKML